MLKIKKNQKYLRKKQQIVFGKNGEIRSEVYFYQ